MKQNISLGFFLILLIFVSFSHAQEFEDDDDDREVRKITRKKHNKATDPADFQLCDYSYRMYVTSYPDTEIKKVAEKKRNDKAADKNLRYFVINCENWAKSKGYTQRFKDVQRVFEPVLAQEAEQARKETIRKETAKREQIKLKEEILVLIENNTEISLILDKCSEYNKSFEILQECKTIQDSIRTQEYITEITASLKANKLEESLKKCNEYKLSLTEDSEEECFRECGIGSSEKITDLCEKQLVAKIKKLPKNKISPNMAKIYYDNFEEIAGKVIQKTDKIILLDGNFNRYSDDKVFLFNTAMVQISGNVGACILPHYNGDSFFGNTQYIGMTTYTTLLGEHRTVPNYKLLWCPNLRGD